jgi:hypothetical protein
MSKPFRPCYRHRLWPQIVAADEAWSAELGRTFGRRSGDARYDERGRSTPRLRALHRRLCRLKRRAGLYPRVAYMLNRRAAS